MICNSLSLLDSLLKDQDLLVIGWVLLQLDLLVDGVRRAFHREQALALRGPRRGVGPARGAVETKITACVYG